MPQGSLGTIRVVLNHAQSPLQSLESRRAKADAGPPTTMQRLAVALPFPTKWKSGPWVSTLPLVLAAEVM
jgi:hypothetical protein